MNRYIGRNPRVILGFIVHIGAFLIALVNLPFDSPIREMTYYFGLLLIIFQIKFIFLGS